MYGVSLRFGVTSGADGAEESLLTKNMATQQGPALLACNKAEFSDEGSKPPAVAVASFLRECSLKGETGETGEMDLQTNSLKCAIWNHRMSIAAKAYTRPSTTCNQQQQASSGKQGYRCDETNQWQQ